jgi:hypothetical protein
VGTADAFKALIARLKKPRIAVARLERPVRHCEWDRNDRQGISARKQSGGISPLKWIYQVRQQIAACRLLGLVRSLSLISRDR